jgi:hypothetical protein
MSGLWLTIEKIVPEDAEPIMHVVDRKDYARRRGAYFLERYMKMKRCFILCRGGTYAPRRDLLVCVGMLGPFSRVPVQMIAEPRR